jgi:hypothetical protein
MVLDMQLQKTPTPPTTSCGTALLVPETPHKVTDLQRQLETIKAFLRQCTYSPPSPTDQVFNQLVKRCHLAMHNGALLANENRELRAAMEKQKKKRSTTSLA